MDIEVFKSSEFGQVRTLVLDNNPYFLGNDVAKILGYKRVGDAISQHVDVEDKKTLTYKAFGDSVQSLWKGNDFSNKTFITESGLYDLIFSSNLPSAKKFKRWVISEVLPSIRKHGLYAVDEVLSNPDMLINALTALKAERQKRLEAETQVEKMTPKAIFADAVSVSKNTILIGELAKILKQNGVEIGANRLFEWLRNNGYLISRKGSDWNMPTQRSMDMGLFRIKETVVTHSDGHTSISKTTKVTGKGQQYLINKFLKGA